MSDPSFWQEPSGQDAGRSTGSPRLSSYIHFNVGGHDVLLERVRETSESKGVYRVTVDEQVQPDLEVAQEDRDDRELLRRAFETWRDRQRAD